MPSVCPAAPAPRPFGELGAARQPTGSYQKPPRIPAEDGHGRVGTRTPDEPCNRKRGPQSRLHPGQRQTPAISATKQHPHLPRDEAVENVLQRLRPCQCPRSFSHSVFPDTDTSTSVTELKVHGSFQSARGPCPELSADPVRQGNPACTGMRHRGTGLIQSPNQRSRGSTQIQGKGGAKGEATGQKLVSTNRNV